MVARGFWCDSVGFRGKRRSKTGRGKGYWPKKERGEGGFGEGYIDA
jgi:hypothetical protein